MDQTEYARVYHSKYVKHKVIYVGPGTCPRCGKHGYFSLRQQFNIKTGVIYPHFHLEVRHYHTGYGHRTVYDGFCYIKAAAV